MGIDEGLGQVAMDTTDRIPAGSRIAVVVPVFDERDCVQPLYDELQRSLGDADWHVWFVNDGSTDGTDDVLESMAQAHANVHVLHFSRNFGHMAALTAGLDHAEGDVVITMDGDLQHPPSLIPEMINEWRAGADVVQCIRMESEGATVFKRLSSRCFYTVFRYLADIDLESNAADFRLLDRRVVDALKGLHERNRFLRGLVWWAGFKRKLLTFRGGKRLHGASKYTTRKMLRFAVRAIVSFSAVPLRLILFAGILLFAAVILYAAYAVAAFLLTSRVQPGWLSMMLVVLFFSSVQLIAMGVLGQYVATIYDEVKGRPVYLLRDKRGTHGT